MSTPRISPTNPQLKSRLKQISTSTSNQPQTGSQPKKVGFLGLPALEEPAALEVSPIPQNTTPITTLPEIKLSPIPESREETPIPLASSSSTDHTEDIGAPLARRFAYRIPSTSTLNAIEAETKSVLQQQSYSYRSPKKPSNSFFGRLRSFFASCFQASNSSNDDY